MNGLNKKLSAMILGGAVALAGLAWAPTSSAKAKDEEQKENDRIQNAGTVVKEILDVPDDIPQGGRSSRQSPDLEARVALLEVAVNEIRSDLKGIREELANLKNVPLELAEIKGRLSNIPTSFQLVFILATFAVTTFVGATGLSLAIIKLSH